MCDETSLANVTERTMGCDLEPNLVLNESIPRFHKDSSYTFLDEVLFDLRVTPSAFEHPP